MTDGKRLRLRHLPDSASACVDGRINCWQCRPQKKNLTTTDQYHTALRRKCMHIAYCSDDITRCCLSCHNSAPSGEQRDPVTVNHTSARTHNDGNGGNWGSRTQQPRNLTSSTNHASISSAKPVPSSQPETPPRLGPRPVRGTHQRSIMSSWTSCWYSSSAGSSTVRKSRSYWLASSSSSTYSLCALCSRRHAFM